MIKVGVIGAAYGTMIHAPSLLAEGFDVVAICSDDLERAESEAARLGIARAVRDVEVLLAIPGLDAVTISGPTGLYHDHALAALRAGKHVLCEKPFAKNAALGKEMLDLAQSTGLTAMVAHEFRFTSGRARMKELIDQGYLGTPKLALVRLMRGPTEASEVPPTFVEENDSAEAGGGFLLRMGSHYTDALRHFFGEVAEVEGRLFTMAPERTLNGETVQADADDTFMFDLHFDNGVVAQMVGARATPFASEFSISVWGTEGFLATPQEGINPPSHGTLIGARFGERTVPETLPIPSRLEPIEDLRDDRIPPWRLMAREFARGITTGTSPSPSFLDAYRCMQVLDAVRLSSAIGTRVQIGH